MNKTNRIMLCVAAALLFLILVAVGGRVDTADEQAICARFPGSQKMTLYHDTGNVPQPAGVDWSRARSIECGMGVLAGGGAWWCWTGRSSM